MPGSGNEAVPNLTCPGSVPRRIFLIWGVLIMTHVHSLSTEWLPISISPPDGDLEVCVMDYDGLVRALGARPDRGCDGHLLQVSRLTLRLRG